MGGLAEIAASMLAMTERRLETVSHNVANTGTSGFKAQDTFQNIISGRDPAVSAIFTGGAMAGAREGAEGVQDPLVALSRMAQGQLKSTGKPWDLALSGQGMFALRDVDTDALIYTRHGAFGLDAEGFVSDASGRRLQSADWADLRIDDGEAEVLADGTVVMDGIPYDRVGVFAADTANALEALGGTDFRARDGAHMDMMDDGTIRQGMLESSNVELADEVVNMMEAVRQAETGARLMQTYDTLMGQAISAFGQGGR